MEWHLDRLEQGSEIDMKKNSQKEQENEERSILSWIGLDEKGLKRIGVKGDLDLHEKLIFWLGLLFSGRYYYPSDELIHRRINHLII